jgi:hypothetical protein
VQDEEIEAELLAIHTRGPEESCRRLVRLAVNRGGEDTVTVVIGRAGLTVSSLQLDARRRASYGACSERERWECAVRYRSGPFTVSPGGTIERCRRPRPSAPRASGLIIGPRRAAPATALVVKL